MQASLDQIREELWRRGQLSWLLYEHQKPIYSLIQNVINSTESDANSYLIDCSRQYGKSFLMFLTAVEQCIRHDHHTIAYIGPLKSQVIEIVTEKTFRTIFDTAPKDLVPRLDGSALLFNNGSRIRLAGTDNRNYENLRGGIAHQILLDEAGFMANLLDGVLPSVTPMLKTTGGKLIYASTPPDSLDHDYHEILKQHDETGHISTFTIWDDKTLTPKQLDKIIRDCKGQETTLFKREYECQRIVESERQVVPELSKEVCEKIQLKDTSFKAHPYHRYWTKYVVADWGGRDKTAILFAHYNPQTRKVIVEDHLDLVGSKISSGRIAYEIKTRMGILWHDACQDVRYICDSNNILIQNDMIETHGLNFISTTKDRLADQMVQKVRDWVYEERVLFAPDAEFALNSSMNAWWSKSRNAFAQSRVYGHYDHLAALVYLIRNIDEVRNNVPGMLNFNPVTQFNSNITTPANESYAGLANIFGRKNG